MNNSEKYKKELDNICAPEELIKGEIKMVEERKEKRKFNFKYVVALASVILVSVMFFTIYSNSQIKNSKETKVEKRDFASFLEDIDKNISVDESGINKIVIDIKGETVEVYNLDIYKRTMKIIEEEGTGKYLKSVSRVKFDKKNLKNYYKLYSNNYILYTVNDKYMFVLSKKNNEYIQVIELDCEKYTEYDFGLKSESQNLISLKSDIETLFNELKEEENNSNSNIENSNSNSVVNSNSNTENSNVTTSNSNPTSNKPEEKLEPKTYGDVDRDGKINSRDVLLIKRHVNKIEKITDPDALKAADINGDGYITGADAVILQHAVTKIIPFDGNSQLKNVTVYGDVNYDGEITQSDYNDIDRHIKGEIKLTNPEFGDINGDGKLNNLDLALIKGLLNGTFKHNNKIEPLTDYVLYGDVNLDGKVTINDSTVLKQYLIGKRTLDKQQLKNADVNKDGKIDDMDAKLIQEFATEMHEGTLPYKPIK